MKNLFPFIIFVLGLLTSVDSTANAIYIGGNSGGWTNPSNWENGHLPDGSESVYINASVDCPTGLNCADLEISYGAVFICNGDLTCTGHFYLKSSDAVINGNVICKEFDQKQQIEYWPVYYEGGLCRMTCTGNFDSHPGHFYLNGYASVGGDIGCIDINMNNSSTLVCGGSIDTHGNNLIVGSGSVNVTGDISCGYTTMSSGASFVCSGNVDTNGQNFQAAGNVDVAGDLIGGYTTIDSGTKLKVDGEFRANGGLGYWSIQMGDGTEILIDILEDAINHSVSQTKDFIDKMIQMGAYKAVVKSSWTGAAGDGNWFNEENWLDSKGVKVVPDNYTDVTIDNSASNMPVVGERIGDEVAIARKVYIVNETPEVNLTVDGGVMSVKYMYVKNKNIGSALVIKHKFDKMSSFRVETGEVLVGEASAETTISYNGVRVEKTLQTGVTYYMGSATTEGAFAEVNNRLDGGLDEIYSYNTSNQGYDLVRGFPNSYRGGSVYLYWYNNDLNRTIVQTGRLHNSEAPATVSLDMYEDGSYGWNMISNPYQYSYPLSDGTQFTRTGVDFVTFRRFNRSTKKYESVTYSFGADVSVPNDEKYIAPQQAFFVKAKEDNLVFGFNPYAVAKGADTPVKKSSLKAAKVVNDVLYLSLNGNVSSKGEDQTALVFREGGSLSVNSIDADKKMESAVNNQLYLLKEGGEYAIGLYPEVGDMYDEVIPLGYIAAKGATEATIRAINLSEFDQNTDVLLLDMYSGDSYDLRENDTYSFSVDESGVRVDDRFAIALKANKSAESDVPTSLEDVEKSVIAISGSTGAVVVDLVGLDGEADVCIYDVAGRVVSRAKASNGINRISVASKGVCVVEVVGGKAVKNAKVIVR